MEPSQQPAGYDPFAAPPVARHVPSGFTPYASAVAVPAKRSNAWWIAAGVLQAVQALFLLGVGAWAFAVAGDQDDVFGFSDLIRVLAVIMIAVGAVTMVAAIGCLSSKLWGAVVGLTVNGLFLLMTMSGGTSGGNRFSERAVPLMWLSAIVVLCVIGMTRRRA